MTPFADNVMRQHIARTSIKLRYNKTVIYLKRNMTDSSRVIKFGYISMVFTKLIVFLSLPRIQCSTIELFD